MQAFATFFSWRPLWLGGIMVLILAGGGWWRWNARAASGLAADDSGTRILLGLAADAQRDGRLLAPVGNNAFGFYFSVLQIEPYRRPRRSKADQAAR